MLSQGCLLRFLFIRRKINSVIFTLEGEIKLLKKARIDWVQKLHKDRDQKGANKLNRHFKNYWL